MGMVSVGRREKSLQKQVRMLDYCTNSIAPLVLTQIFFFFFFEVNGHVVSLQTVLVKQRGSCW